MTLGARFPRPHVLAFSLVLGLACANALRASGTLAVVAGGAVLLVALVAPGRHGAWIAATALLLVGWCWGSARLAALDESVLAARVGETAPALAVVTGPARRGTFALRVPARLERFGRSEMSEAILLELPRGRAPPQGSRLRLVVRLALPRVGGSFDERSWLRRRGVHVVAHGTRWAIVGHRGGLAGLGDRLRARLARTVSPGVGGERRAVVAGIVLGEDEGLPEELRERFRAAGIYHLLAVSGQNVVLLGGGVLLLVWLLGLPRWLGELGVLAAIGGYVLAVGWQPSVVRAGVAGALASLAWLAARPRDRWYFLLLGAIVLLAWNPNALLEPGFQLSFAAVSAIFVAVARIERRLEGYPVPARVASVLAVSVACGLVTAPIVWLHFGAVPLYAVLGNALAAPAVAPLLALGLSAAAVDPVLPSVGLALGLANGWLAAYLAACARLVGGLPHAELTSGSELAVAGVLTAALVALARTRDRRRRQLAALLAVVLLAGLGWTLLPDERAPPAGLRVTFLDVGQGDAVLVETPTGAVLVDQGPPEGRAADQLRRLGVRRLALLVLTHPQRDHVGGAADVLERIRVDLVLDPRLPAPSPDEAAALAAARRREVRVLTARAGAVYRLGALRITVLWPDGPGAPGLDPNQRAVVLLVSLGEADLLLTADAEADVTTRLRLPPVEILKVAHHGSADPLLPELLRRTRPRVAVISVGRGNDYGHPTASTLRALQEADGLTVYRTDRDGRVTVEVEGERLRVRREREL